MPAVSSRPGSKQQPLDDTKETMNVCLSLQSALTEARDKSSLNTLQKFSTKTLWAPKMRRLLQLWGNSNFNSKYTSAFTTFTLVFLGTREGIRLWTKHQLKLSRSTSIQRDSKFQSNLICCFLHCLTFRSLSKIQPWPKCSPRNGSKNSKLKL